VGSEYWPAWQVGFNVLLCPIKHQYLASDWMLRDVNIQLSG